jgi:hypothetical protein
MTPIEISVEVKMRRVFLVMAACCIVASPALAGGGVDLFASYGEVVDSESEFGLGFRVSLGGTHWMADAGFAGYQTVENFQIIDESPYENDDFKYRVYDLGLRYVFYDEYHKLRPYLGGGASLASSSTTYARVDNDLGFYAIAGLRYGKTPGIQFMGELIYRWAEAEVSYDLIDEDDVTVGGLALQVGLSFIF